MAVVTKLVNGLTGITQGANVDLTSPGFGTPDAAIVFVNPHGALNGAAKERAGISFGIMTSAGQSALGSYESDGKSTTTSTRSSHDTSVVALPDDPTAKPHRIRMTGTFITDGIRLFADVVSTAQDMGIVALLIKGVTNANFETLPLNFGARNIGFAADVVLCAAQGGGVIPQIASSWRESIGWSLPGNINGGAGTLSRNGRSAGTECGGMVSLNSAIYEMGNTSATWRYRMDIGATSYTPVLVAGTASADIPMNHALKFDVGTLVDAGSFTFPTSGQININTQQQPSGFIAMFVDNTTAYDTYRISEVQSMNFLIVDSDGDFASISSSNRDAVATEFTRSYKGDASDAGFLDYFGTKNFWVDSVALRADGIDLGITNSAGRTNLGVFLSIGGETTAVSKIFQGSNRVDTLNLGSNNVDAVYVGTEKVFG
jgi:hypothetical protein